jgi:hypothetical protein
MVSVQPNEEKVGSVFGEPWTYDGFTMRTAPGLFVANFGVANWHNDYRDLTMTGERIMACVNALRFLTTEEILKSSTGVTPPTVEAAVAQIQTQIQAQIVTRMIEYDEPLRREADALPEGALPERHLDEMNLTFYLRHPAAQPVQRETHELANRRWAANDPWPRGDDAMGSGR